MGGWGGVSWLFPTHSLCDLLGFLLIDNRQPPPHVTLSCLHTVALLQEDNEYLLGFIIRAHICQADNLELQQSEIAFGSASVTGGLLAVKKPHPGVLLAVGRALRWGWETCIFNSVH